MRIKLLKRINKRFLRSYTASGWFVLDHYSGDSISCETTQAAVYFIASHSLPPWRFAKWVRKVLAQNGGWGKHAINWHRAFTYFDK